MPTMQAIPISEFRQQRWANGNGQTTELAAGPNRDRWLWRISMAQIECDGDFSVLPGVRRQLAPLDGGLELRLEDGQTHVAKRLQVICFSGDQHATCHLPDGPGRDINLMLRDGVDGQLIARPLLDSMMLPHRAGTRWFALMLAGDARAENNTEQLLLASGEAAWLQPHSGERILIQGAGEIALIRLHKTQDVTGRHSGSLD